MPAEARFFLLCSEDMCDQLQKINVEVPAYFLIQILLTLEIVSNKIIL